MPSINPTTALGPPLKKEPGGRTNGPGRPNSDPEFPVTLESVNTQFLSDAPRHSFLTAFSVGILEKTQSRNPPLLREQTSTTPSPLNFNITPSPESCE